MFKSGAGSHHPLLVLTQKTAKVALFKDIPFKNSIGDVLKFMT